VHTAGSRPQAGRPGRWTRRSQSHRIPRVGDIADVIGLADVFNDVVRRLRPCGTGRDPGRLAVYLAVMLAGVGESFTDPVLRIIQGRSASSLPPQLPWRLLAGTDTATPASLRAAWPTAGRPPGCRQLEPATACWPSTRAKRDLPGLVLDLDAHRRGTDILSRTGSAKTRSWPTRALHD
jgi:hypothetical protein